jgi:BirA family biotin operon repressor/biotin-[acetyl-CoA-carboxylase] ligase
MTPRHELHLDTSHLGQRVLVFDRLDSTNTYAAQLAEDPANAGVVVLADEQTAGRGQHGRSWSCPRGAGVLMSLLLLPPAGLRRPAVLTAWAAVAVCELIQQTTGLQARIKWPNDVLIRGRKVCGILIEQGRGTVVGLGLNLNQGAEVFERAGLTQAASLAVFTGQTLEVAAVAERLIRTLDAEYDRLAGGDLATLEACWKWRLGLLGRRVQVESLQGVQQGRLREIGFSALELEGERGEALHFLPETVLQLRAVSG